MKVYWRIKSDFLGDGVRVNLQKTNEMHA